MEVVVELAPRLLGSHLPSKLVKPLDGDLFLEVLGDGASIHLVCPVLRGLVEPLVPRPPCQHLFLEALLAHELEGVRDRARRQRLRLQRAPCGDVGVCLGLAVSVRGAVVLFLAPLSVLALHFNVHALVLPRCRLPRPWLLVELHFLCLLHHRSLARCRSTGRGLPCAPLILALKVAAELGGGREDDALPSALLLVVLLLDDAAALDKLRHIQAFRLLLLELRTARSRQRQRKLPIVLVVLNLDDRSLLMRHRKPFLLLDLHRCLLLVEIHALGLRPHSSARLRCLAHRILVAFRAPILVRCLVLLALAGHVAVLPDAVVLGAVLEGLQHKLLLRLLPQLAHLAAALLELSHFLRSLVVSHHLLLRLQRHQHLPCRRRLQLLPHQLLLLLLVEVNHSLIAEPQACALL
mmetsp:Transcript_28977/g.68725  ORF Transcript_28977/g.68725 Transcript_28977/m.68725 type:complete len:408 (-) Transcript_28977:829-2052(-)